MAIIIIFPGLSSKANDVVLILLIVFASTVLLASITYVVAKGVHLFKEHQETEALARKVWDTEVSQPHLAVSFSRVTTDKPHAQARKDNEEEEDERYRKANGSSLVPSLPPVVIQVPHKKRGYPYFPAIPHAAALAPSFSYGSSLFIVGSRGQAVSPFHASAGNMIKCVAPGRPPLPWAGAIAGGQAGSGS